ncbi:MULTISPECIES: ROK family transcriptional regulator [Inquilinus]|uniref:NBD/HSP70 family sugar kinase n=1 Tax=Inquilinus ginsengisoli TaxID=363840 RepID=A0ABU1JZI6_9PROT|nr:ROK family transcriptional regulator [Inquilinus ginsengisoli]MDR6294037.1 putative NBD/HSP70 family sugar kinase [Inquilinus ginsengisoli]
MQEAALARRAGANLEGASAHNRRVVFDLLRLSGPLSRAELARRTGLSSQTVSNIIEDFAAAGLVETGARVAGGRGQPPTPYRIRPSGGHAIGLHLDHHEVRGVVVDLSGAPVGRAKRWLHAGDPATRVSTLADLADELGRDLAAIDPAAPGRVLGIGLAMPGPFGLPLKSVAGRHADWIESAGDYVQSLTERTGLVVSLENDARMAAIGERMAGAARGLENFVQLFIGQGLGCAIVVEGEVVRGAARNAGEIGMLPAAMFGTPPPDDMPFATLEELVSLWAVARHLGLDPDMADLHDRLEGIRKGESPALADWIAMAADRLRVAVHLLETLFDPETILLGGQLSEPFLERIAAAMTPLLPSLSHRPGRTRPRLIIGTAGPWAVAIGAATEPIARTYAPRFQALLNPVV